jgi:hypothetical protein
MKNDIAYHSKQQIKEKKVFDQIFVFGLRAYYPLRFAKIGRTKTNVVKLFIAGIYNCEQLAVLLPSRQPHLERKYLREIWFFNEADTLKSSSILIFSHFRQSLYACREY